MGGENSGRMAGFAIRQTLEAFGARDLRVAARFLSKAIRLSKRLEGTGDAFSFGSKPKGMHQRTYKRLIVELENLRWAFYSCLAVQFKFTGFEDPDALEEDDLGYRKPRSYHRR